MVSDPEWDACLEDLRVAGKRLSELRERIAALEGAARQVRSDLLVMKANAVMDRHAMGYPGGDVEYRSVNWGQYLGVIRQLDVVLDAQREDDDE